MQLIKPATIAIICGSRAKFLAALAGMINVTVIKITPTTLIETANVIPRAIVKINSFLFELMPLA